jgi:hypothetical protein
MPLKKPQPSSATKKAFQDGLAEMIQLGRAPESLPKVGFPQRTYALSLDDIVKGRGVERAKPVMWEFQVGRDSGPIVIVCIGDPPPKKPPRMTSLTREPGAGEAAKARQQVERLPQVREHSYELRRLRIAALSLGAFWLKSLKKGESDLAVPYQALYEKLKSMHAYPMEEYMSVVLPIAKKRLASETALRRKDRTKTRK